MKITEIDQRHINFKDGLVDIVIRNPGRIVVLAGPNGSGKSRLLRRVSMLNGTAIDTKTSGHCVKSLLKQLPESQFELKSESITSGSLEVNGRKYRAVCYGVKVDTPDMQSMCVASLVPKNRLLKDCDELPKIEVLKNSNAMSSPGVANIHAGCLSYICVVQNRWWDASHPQSGISSESKQDDIESYMRLEELIKDTLGAKIERNRDGQSELFGRPIAKAELSDGQIALLQWAVCLHAQKARLADIVLTLDEPESSLHPEAMIGAISRIIEANRDGQLWIATHSVPLIASLWHRHAADVSLYCMKDGRIYFAGRKPESVLISLLGGEDNRASLRYFLDSPDILAANRYAAEALLAPSVVATSSSCDPQIARVASDIDNVNQKMKVLDFGAGKGRLIAGLFGAFGDKAIEKIDYVAWDCNDSNKKECLAAIAQLYPDYTNRWFCIRDDLVSRHENNSFDRIVLMNVLHEVDPAEWPSFFSSQSLISKMLSTSGSILVVEDYSMPHGECAHKYGFIVLGTESLKELFSCNTSEIRVLDSEDSYTGRVRGHLLARSCIGRVTVETRKKALETAKLRAKNEIQSIRASGDVSFRIGIQHAFWTQQYANVSLALEDLGN